MPKVSESHRRKRRKQILHAAWRCYERQGFHRTSIRDICEEADLSVGAVYSYFDGKEEILEAMAEEAWSDNEALIGSLEWADGLRETCLLFVENILGALDSEAGRRSARVDLRIRAESLDLEHVRERGTEQLGAWREALTEQLERAEDDDPTLGETDDELFEEIADVLVAVLIGAQTMVAIDPERDPAALLRGMRALMGMPGPGGSGAADEEDR